nr:hypothetical protein [Tanacetum cinerariifolium]
MLVNSKVLKTLTVTFHTDLPLNDVGAFSQVISRLPRASDDCEIHFEGRRPHAHLLGLDYGLHSLNVDTDVLEMSNPDVNMNVKKKWEMLALSHQALEMLVHVGTSSTADYFLFGKFKEVKVEADTELEEEESDTEGNDTS